MKGTDWVTWAAVKSIVESVVHTRSTDYPALVRYRKGDRLTLDAYKGTPADFHPWNNQLRQPILLHTHNAVVARAPLSGFLHMVNDLDTLGFDAPASGRKF